jgi:CxxC motif-containing protein (DUF1111 family)
MAEPGDNSQMQTRVCNQMKGVQSVDVISEERILGKFSCEAGRRLAGRAESLRLARTQALFIGNFPWEYATRGGGGGIADA